MVGRVGAAIAAAVVSLGAAASDGGRWSDALGGDAVPRRMTGRGHQAPTAAEAPGLAPAHAIAGGTCELGRAERAQTPSARCMVCHDGGTGTGIEFHMGPRGTSMTHSVEVGYDAIAARQPERYEARAALPAEVPLVAGKVACTSCHDAASRDPKHVAIPVRLCQACHKY